MSLRTEFDEHRNKEIVGGMSKQHATSLLLQQELGALCMDIPVPFDAYDFKKYVDIQLETKKFDGSDGFDTIVPAKTDRQSDRLVNSLVSNQLGNLLDEQSNNQLIKDSQVSYKSYKTIAETVDFYRCQMERLGWQFCYDFQTQESLLFFVKPDKKSVVSIRPYNKKVIHVFVFISSRV